MGDVVDISTYRKKPALRVVGTATIETLTQDCFEEIQGHWEKFARNNRLNEYFISTVSSMARQDVNYLEDLNALSLLEGKIGLEPQIVAPGFAPDNSLGWIASFRINGKCITTSWMVSEQYARCFNILLFLKLKRELVTNGIVVTD